MLYRFGKLEFCTLMHTDPVTAPVRAWQIPPLGRAAEEDVPVWIVQRLLSGEIFINSLGGFTPRGEEMTKASVAGDIVRLMDDDTLAFERPEDASAAVH